MVQLFLVDAQYRTQWESFQIEDQNTIQFLYNVGVINVSQNALDLMLGDLVWNPYTLNGIIGYGHDGPETENERGMTESESYSVWLAHVMSRQRDLRRQLPVTRITQGAYDALLSLYLDTGNWRQVKATEGVYNVQRAVQTGQWTLLADMLQRGKDNALRRSKEAAMVRLGSYSITRQRDQQVTNGLDMIRREYPTLNIFRKIQAESVYYRQLGIVLPGTPELRIRRLTNPT